MTQIQGKFRVEVTKRQGKSTKPREVFAQKRACVRIPRHRLSLAKTSLNDESLKIAYKKCLGNESRG